MCFFFSIISHINSWTPVFHHFIAFNYSEEYFLYSSESQKRSFILGSIYCDGFDKSYTHSVTNIINLINSISDQNSDFYYFCLGLLSHITCDYFAHSGSSLSFITNEKYKHHFSELSICSYVNHLKFIPYISINEE